MIFTCRVEFFSDPETEQIHSFFLLTDAVYKF
jgi:hypothetical protein